MAELSVVAFAAVNFPAMVGTPRMPAPESTRRNARPAAAPSPRRGRHADREAPAPEAAPVAAPVAASEAAPVAALVPAVERAVRLIDALAASREPLGLAELARRLALPKSSVHGLLATLVAHGLARRDDQGAFSLGSRPLQWADAFASQSDVLRAFDLHAQRAQALTAETVMLAVLEVDQVVYLACRPGSRPLAVNFRVGGRFPASCTSSGKAMLATLPPERLQGLLGDASLPALTRHSVASLPALRRQLAQTRKLGVAIDDEETAEGMQCFGAPVFGPRRAEAVAAVAVSVIKAGLDAPRRQELVAAIGALARQLSAALGALPQAA
jgi:DNA-binding IclR family transcriptional regulator